MINIIFHNKITNPLILNSIWEILCECDQEFYPPLSARGSSLQNHLQLDHHNINDVPKEYFNEIKNQQTLLAFNEDSHEIAAFMTFKHQYYCEELEQYGPSNYITTICVSKRYRNRGITKKFYNYILSGNIPTKYQLPYFTTRTWSSNTAHIHVLKTIGFELSTTLKDHRGQGIDTIYFAKSLK